MKTRRFRTSLLITVASFAVLLAIVAGCRDDGSITPFEPTPLPNAFLHSFSAFPTTLGLGGREAVLTAYVVDAEGNPVGGETVHFSSDLGEVEETAVSDSLGVAIAVFKSGSQKGTASIVASIGSIQFKASVLIGANELIIGETTALADGRTVISVSASVFRPDGSAAQRAFVTFSSTAGTIPSQALTDSSGWVSVNLTAPASSVDIQAEIAAFVNGSELDPTGAFGIPPDEDQTVGIGVIQFRGITLTLSSEKAELVASGSDSTEVYCLVAETVSRIPVPGIDVFFGTDLGSITSPIRANESGIAIAMLQSDIFPGTAEIVSFIETLTDTTRIEFTPLTLTGLKAAPRTILTGGDQSDISTRLLNQNNNPVEGMTIHFETTIGVIPGEGITDSLGRVVVLLTSSDTVGTALVTARFGSLSVSTNVSFEDPISDPIRLTEIWWDPIPVADGESGTYVSTRLLNQTNNPVTGRIVEFATDLGVIVEVDTTDSTGTAAAWLTAIESADTAFAYVTASHGSLSVSTTIPFMPPASQTPVAMTLAPAVNSIQVSGAGALESVVLTATAFDAGGDTVAAGSDVTFRIVSGPGGGEYLVWPDSGSGAEVTVPITEGAARITLNAGTLNGVVALQAETSGGVLASASITVVSGPPAFATISIDSTVSVASGGGMFAWKMAVLITDAYSNPVVGETPVFVTLHADTCGTGIAPLGLSISGDVYTENVPSCQALKPEPGLAYGCIVGPYINFSEFPSFAIEARSGTNELLACLVINHGATNSEPTTIQLVSVEDSTLSVAGVGGDETATLVWEVRDARGFPVGVSNQVDVDFEIVASPGGGVLLTPTTATTDGEGLVYTTLQSGTNAGVVKIKARTGTIESSAASIAIHGGPPDAAHFSLAAQHVNIAGLLLLGIEDPITAFVFDKFSNPVPPGTAVYFTTDFGGILGSGVTDDAGQAVATLYSALPLPSCADNGMVNVTARTFGEGALEISATANILFSGGTTISSIPSTFTIGPGGFQDIFVTVSDQCGNPLTQGTRVDISSSGGSLVGALSTTLPDTRNQANTQFWVRLSDDEAAEPDSAAPPPENHSIEVKVNSVNGNATFIIFGTID